MSSTSESKLDQEVLLKSVPEKKRRLIELCHRNFACRYGHFTLKSGVTSNFFFDSGALSDFESLDLMTDLILAKLLEHDVKFDTFFGIPYKAIPIVSVLCLKYYYYTGKKIYFAYNRKEYKDHGECDIFVGAYKLFAEGSNVVLVDDVLTNGTSLRRTLSLLEASRAKVAAFIVFLNRESKHGEVAKRHFDKDFKFLEIFRIEEMLERVHYNVETTPYEDKNA